MSPRHPRIHLIMTLLWCAVIPVWYFTDLRSSVAFVGAVSIYANLVGHWSAHEAAQAAYVAKKVLGKDAP